MPQALRYDPATAEAELQAYWEETGTNRYDPEAEGPVYAIDTPPPTVSGHLHLGHVYSYSQTDFMARFWRMNGYNVYYPMGYDDNGLPTERLVERLEKTNARRIGREAFVERCLAVSAEAEVQYRQLWERLGLSIDWRYTYRTIGSEARRAAQWSFIDLYRKGLVYRREAPAIWCPECRTAIAEAELNDLERESEFVTLDFRLEDGTSLPIATTRPELLPACVAVFVHPDDTRYAGLVGKRAILPLATGQSVLIMADPGADPAKGTGAVMCCTFGDSADVAWWRGHSLPLVELIGRDGKVTEAGGQYAGLSTAEARRAIVADLSAAGRVLGRQPVLQSVRVHERCDTPVEYIVTAQWFVDVLNHRDELLQAGEAIEWQPPHMLTRYRDWVEGLRWDWCLSRQRTFGVPFPVWYCTACGAVVLASEDSLPVDPATQAPEGPCSCGNQTFAPETDVMDTWATSSLSPQIAGGWSMDPQRYGHVFPYALRPQAHEIIRTWAFYTIVKSLYHFGTLPWRTVAISGWGLAPEGSGKISKSRGGGPMAPMEMIGRYSADAVRYWAACTPFGRDSVISEQKIQAGARLVTKLWNVAGFAGRFLGDAGQIEWPTEPGPADRWILARTQSLIRRVTAAFRDYDYAAAKAAVEEFLWADLADNYLEMAKLRLYDAAGADKAACYALHQALLATVKLLAPILPHITEAIYQSLFARREGCASIHRAAWPLVDPAWEDQQAEDMGGLLVSLAGRVRRYKSEHDLSPAAPLSLLSLASAEPVVVAFLRSAQADLASVTRASAIEFGETLAHGVERLAGDEEGVEVGLIP